MQSPTAQPLHDFERQLHEIDGVLWFTTTCEGCGASFAAQIIGKMPKWEAEHTESCPALVLTED